MCAINIDVVRLIVFKTELSIWYDIFVCHICIGLY